MQKLLDYHFNDQALLEQALTHRSIGQNNNERLEYLGDALLGFIIAEALYVNFPAATEGELTRLRATLVKRETLASLGRNEDLSQHLKLGSGELKSGGWRRDSILSNTVEALIGAIYLDSDFEQCRNCVLAIYDDLLESVSPDNAFKDPKTELQEFLQARKISLPTYSVIEESGQPHDLTFSVKCSVDCLDEAVVAKGKSKRNAEQSAARIALKKLQSDSSNN